MQATIVEANERVEKARDTSRHISGQEAPRKLVEDLKMAGKSISRRFTEIADISGKMTHPETSEGWYQIIRSRFHSNQFQCTSCLCTGGCNSHSGHHRLPPIVVDSRLFTKSDEGVCRERSPSRLGERGEDGVSASKNIKRSKALSKFYSGTSIQYTHREDGHGLSDRSSKAVEELLRGRREWVA